MKLGFRLIKRISLNFERTFYGKSFGKFESKIKFNFCTNNKNNKIFQNELKQNNHTENFEKIIKRLDLGLIKRDDYINYLTLCTNFDSTLYQANFLKYLNLAISKNILNHNTYTELLPFILNTASKLKLDSDEFWKVMNDLFKRYSHKLGVNLILHILETMNSYYPNNEQVNLLKGSYFKNLTRDKILVFNIETLLNYLNTFIDVHKDQDLINDIQNLIVNLSKDFNIENNVCLSKNLLNFLDKNKLKLNFSILVLHLKNIIEQNKQLFTKEEIINLFTVLSNYLDKEHLTEFANKVNNKII